MKAAEARKMFQEAINNEQSADKRDDIRLLMEYFTNAEFKKKMEDFVWNQLQAK